MIRTKALSSLLALLAVGCIQAPATRPVTAAVFMASAAPTTAQVNSCQSTMHWHNAWVILGTIFGGLAGTAGGIEATPAASDANIKTGIGIGAAAAGLLSAVTTTASGLAAASYSLKGCDTVLASPAAASLASVMEQRKP